ncbi:hypothetical protein COLO4_25681 [Corchorus olitorius]|uniref:Uncharacterized protein n=1 Tax=Corchorus olitorius TaxID=93759 RepID=A0A1R3I0E7_9ROSI|nr:hypothetical protein COLO4_25681 [Corchorus olitorius]
MAIIRPSGIDMEISCSHRIPTKESPTSLELISFSKSVE